MIIRGSCLCGQVSYRVTEPLGSADHCHCSMCRRQHGAAFATYADCRPSSFFWSTGEEQVAYYEAAGGGGWVFCRVCGSSLAGTSEGVVTSIALGSVQGDPGIRPACHIFVGSKAGWYEIEDRLPQFIRRAGEDDQ